MKRKTTLEKLQDQKKNLEFNVDKLQETINYLTNQIEDVREQGKYYVARYIDNGMRSAINKMNKNSNRINELNREIKSLSSLQE